MNCSHETEDWQMPALPALRTRASELPALATMVHVTHTIMGAQDNMAMAVDYAVHQAEARWIWAEMHVMAGNPERAQALRQQAKWILSQFRAEERSGSAQPRDEVTVRMRFPDMAV